MHKELQVPLLELTLAEQEVPRSHLVAERLADLADTERDLHTRGLQHVFVVQVDVLAGLTAQVGLHALALDDADVCLHHQVEEARLTEFPAADRALVLLEVLCRQLIDAETSLAVLALYQPVYEVFDMAAGLPHTRMRDDGPLDPHDIVIDLHHRPPPVATDVVAQFNAQRPKVIDAGDPTVDLGVGEDEAASLS